LLFDAAYVKDILRGINQTLDNPSFEENLKGWTPYTHGDGSVSINTALAKNGLKSVDCDAPPTKFGNHAQVLQDIKISAPCIIEFGTYFYEPTKREDYTITFLELLLEPYPDYLKKYLAEVYYYYDYKKTALTSEIVYKDPLTDEVYYWEMEWIDIPLPSPDEWHLFTLRVDLEANEAVSTLGKYSVVLRLPRIGPFFPKYATLGYHYFGWGK